MKPKGKLLIIGGAEHKGEESLDMENKNIRFKRYEILKELITSAKNSPIEIITTGSRIPQEVRRSYERACDRIGYGKPGFLPIRSRADAKDKSFLHRIEKAGAVFFTGGDQSRLAEILGSTPIVKLISERFFNDSDFLLSGTSAGAMALSDVMITGGGDSSEAIIWGDMRMAKGLNIFSNFIIDTHFIKRGRFGRLAKAVAKHPNHLGIGLGEDTALIVKNGYIAECRGSGMVVIIDGRFIRKNNIKFVKKGEPIFMENLKVHLLVKGARFSLKTFKLI